MKKQQARQRGRGKAMMEMRHGLRVRLWAAEERMG